MRKDHEAERHKLREQIRTQQATLDNMEFDFRNLGLRQTFETTQLNEDAQEEVCSLGCFSYTCTELNTFCHSNSTIY